MKLNGVSRSAVFYFLSIQKYKSHVVKTMNNQDMKIYFDSSHYIGIPKEAFARKKGSKSHVVKSVQKIQKNKRLKHQLKPQKNVLKTFIIPVLNANREAYLKTKDKKYWWQMIQLLPSSYNQKRTVMLNYEVLANIFEYRKSHKLDEWVEFCKWIKTLPYSEIITKKEELK